MSWSRYMQPLICSIDSKCMSGQEFYKERLADGGKYIRVERLRKQAGIPHYKMMRDPKRKRASGSDIAGGTWNRSIRGYLSSTGT